MIKNHIEAYLSNLAVQKNVAVATQGLALVATTFLIRKCLIYTSNKQQNHKNRNIDSAG